MTTPIARLSSSGDASPRIKALLCSPNTVSPKTSPREASSKTLQGSGQSPRDIDKWTALFSELLGPLVSVSENAIHILSSFFEIQEDDVKGTIRKVAFQALNVADKSYNRKHAQAIEEARESIESKVHHLRSVNERSYKEAFVREQCAFERSLWRQEVIERFGPGYIPVIELAKKGAFAKLRSVVVTIARSNLKESEWKQEMKKIKGKKEALLTHPCDLDLLYAQSAKDPTPYQKFAKESVACLASRADEIYASRKVSNVINELRQGTKEDRVILLVDSFAKCLLSWLRFQNEVQGTRAASNSQRSLERSLSQSALTPTARIEQLKVQILHRIDANRLSKTAASTITIEQTKAFETVLRHVRVLKSSLKNMLKLFDLYLEIDQKNDISVRMRSVSISSKRDEGPLAMYVQGLKNILEILRKMNIPHKLNEN